MISNSVMQTINDCNAMVAQADYYAKSAMAMVPPKAGQVPSPDQWGKGNATAPTDTPKIGFKEVAMSLIPTALEMLTKGAEDKKKAAEKVEADKKAKAEEEKEAKKLAEQREFELKKARIEAGKDDPPADDKK